MNKAIKQLLFMGGGGSLPFASKVAALSPYVWWKLDEASGTTIVNYGGAGAAYNGALTLGSGALGAAGIGDGGTSITFDGTATAITNTDPISDAQGREGTLMCWCKLEAGTWTDGANRIMRIDRTDNDNYLRMGRVSTNNQLGFTYEAGGTIQGGNWAANTTADWFILAVSYSLAGNFCKGYQVLKGGGTVTKFEDTGVGAFVGAAALWQMGYAGNYLKGNFAHFIVFPTALTEAQLVELAKV